MTYVSRVPTWGNIKNKPPRSETTSDTYHTTYQKRTSSPGFHNPRLRDSTPHCLERHSKSSFITHLSPPPCLTPRLQAVPAHRPSSRSSRQPVRQVLPLTSTSPTKEKERTYKPERERVKQTH